MTQEEKKAVLDGHLKYCKTCARANKRVNDFCDLGRSLFLQWAEEEEPIAATVLSAEEYRRVVEEEAARVERARWN
jgi:hypothetical protein